MLSRLAIRNGGGRLVALRAASTTPSASGPAQPKALVEGPDRDLVNFPRMVRKEHPDKVRLGFIPEEWFQALHDKTGVTGPYMFGVGLITYLCSKEIYVLEHEFYTMIPLGLIGYYMVKKLGPGVSKFMDKQVDEESQMWTDFRNNSMKGALDGVAAEKKAQFYADGQKMLFEAKKENVGLQLEAAFRARQMEVYNEVKRRLDFHAESEGVAKGFQQKHLVDWVVSKVRASVTPQLEQAAMKSCMAELKALAAAT